MDLQSFDVANDLQCERLEWAEHERLADLATGRSHEGGPNLRQIATLVLIALVMAGLAYAIYLASGLGIGTAL